MSSVETIRSEGGVLVVRLANERRPGAKAPEKADEPIKLVASPQNRDRAAWLSETTVQGGVKRGGGFGRRRKGPGRPKHKRRKGGRR